MSSAHDHGLTWGSAQGRWVVAAAVLGSGMAGIDATVVNVALPAVGADLDADFAALQWVVVGYSLTLASFILLGGSLGDRFGRRRVFALGVTWFAIASALCGLAPTAGLLLAARALQGVGGALLTPASLSILQATFVAGDRGRAIGAWSGLGGVATAIGPFLGGWLIESVSWRWVFWINLPVALVVLWTVHRHVPETADPDASARVDVTGSALGALTLACLTYALIRGSGSGLDAVVVVVAVVGVLAAAALVIVERRSEHPVLPPSIFAVAQFRAVNLLTFVVYGALGVVFFLLVVQLQVVAGFGAIAAGTSLLPVTVVMLALSSRSGELASRIGPRRQLVAGPLICAAALFWMLPIGAGSLYWRDVLPPVTLFGLGLAVMVAPLTSTALSSVSGSHAGLASGVNNAVARTGGLVAVAAVPALVGLTGADYREPTLFDAGFDRAMVVGAVLLLLGALVAIALVRDPDRVTTDPAHGADAAHGALGADGSRHVRHCAVAAPPQLTRTAPESHVRGEDATHGGDL